MKTIPVRRLPSPLLAAALLLFLSLIACEGPGTHSQQAANATAPGKPQPTPPTHGCSFDNDVSTLGQGLLIMPDKFSIFRDSLLADTLAHLDMYRMNPEQTPVCPKYFKPDYGIMHFVYLDSTKKAYRILLNQADVGYAPRQSGYKLVSWPKYILSSLAIRRNYEEAQVANTKLLLRTTPQDSAAALSISKGLEMFCPLEVQGDWVRVRYDCFYNKASNPHEGQPCSEYIAQCKTAPTGWLRWRQDNKLVIDIMLLP